MAQEIGALRALLSLDSAAFERGARRAQASMTGLQRSLERASQNMRRVGRRMSIGLTAPIVAGAGLAVRSSLQVIDAQAKMAQSLGTTTQSMQVLARAAETTGISQSELEGALTRMTRRLSLAEQGTGPAVAALERLGIAAEDMVSLDAADRVALIQTRIEAVIPATEQAAVSSQIFGDRVGVAMQRLDPTAIAAAAAEIDRFGVGVSEVEADQIEAANDAMSALGLAATGLANQLTVALAPTLTRISEIIASVAEAFNNLTPTQKRLAAGAVALTAALGPIAIALGAVLAGLAAIASPIGLVIGGLVLLGGAAAAASAYIFNNWDDLRARFPGITGAIEGAIGLMGAAFNVVKDVVVGVVNTVEALLSGDWVAAWEAAKSVADPFIDAFQDVRDRLREIIRGWIATAVVKVDELKTSITDIASRAVEAFLDFFRNLGPRLVALIGEGVDAIVAAAAGWVTKMGEIGRDMVNGLIEGIRERTPNLGAEAAAMGRGAETAARRALETQSPSRVFRRIGNDVGDGLALGMEDMAADIAATAESIGEQMTAAISDGLGDPEAIGKDFVSGLLDGMSSGNIMDGLSRFLGNARQSFMSSPMMSGISSALGGALSGAMPIIGGISTAMNLINGFSSREKVGETATTRGVLGMGGGLFEQIREEFEKTSFWGLKTSREIKTSFRELDDETRQVREAFGGLIAGVRDAGAPLGIVADKFRDLKVPIVDGDIAGALARADDAIAGMIPGLSGLRQEGETVAQTLGRLSGALSTYNAAARAMRLPSLPGTVAGAGRAASILSDIDLGGAESALFGMQDPGMQVRLITSQINREMRRIGLSGPVRDADQLLARIQAASGAGRARAAAGLASLAPLVGQRDALRDQINDGLARDREEAARAAEQRRLDALRASEEAARDAARAEEELARARDALSREVAGFNGFSTFREEQIAQALAGRAGANDELKDVLENLWATMRIIAENTGRSADDTSILVAQGVV